MEMETQTDTTIQSTAHQQVDIALEMEFDNILTIAKQKFRDGAKKHGYFNPVTDLVDRIYEAENELIDNINYSLMQITKLRRLGENIKKIEDEFQSYERKLNVLRNRDRRFTKSKLTHRIYRRTRKR